MTREDVKDISSWIGAMLLWLVVCPAVVLGLLWATAQVSCRLFPMACV